jgi:hypothetical protein
VNNTLAATLGLVGVIAALVVAAIFIHDPQTFGIISAVVVGAAVPAFISLLQSNKAATHASDAAGHAEEAAIKSTIAADNASMAADTVGYQGQALQSIGSGVADLIRVQPALEPTPPTSPSYPPDKAQYDAPSETPLGTTEPPYTGKA